MSIKNYSREQVTKALQESASYKEEKDIKIVFVPRTITEDNFKQVTEVYGSVYDERYDTVVLLNDSEEELEYPICMTDLKKFITPFGTVEANDDLRNEFADEEDDFFINNDGYEDRVGMNDHLMMLQCAILEPFNVVNIELSKDERPSIIRELAFVLQEVLGLRNVLIVVCVDLHTSQSESFEKLNYLMTNWERSNFLNTLLQDETQLIGKSGFMAGVLVAKAWDLWTDFVRPFKGADDESLVAGYSYKKLD
jgi:AmmeMemoRadiSam system protein B